MKIVAPNYHARQQMDTVCQTNTIPYRADYFGQKLHVDENKKMEIYGVVHVVTIDMHSHYITCGATMPRKNSKKIYTAVYRFILFLFCLIFCWICWFFKIKALWQELMVIDSSCSSAVITPLIGIFLRFVYFQVTPGLFLILYATSIRKTILTYGLFDQFRVGREFYLSLAIQEQACKNKRGIKESVSLSWT